ncbi:putative ribonuclease H-like domain-containing protein [Tanacetum coccineum]
MILMLLVSTAGPSFDTVVPSTPVNTIGPSVSTANESEEQLFERFSPFKNAFTLPLVLNISSIDNTSIFGNAYDDDDVEEEVDMNTVISSYSVPNTSFTKFHKDHPEDQVIGSLKTPVQTRHITKITEEHGLFSSVHKLRRKNHKDLQNCLFACFLSQMEPMKPVQALKDPSWEEAMQNELLQFKLLNVWTLVDLPRDKWAIEEGIDYDEVFAPVARIEAIRLFLAYASFKDFVFYQMDVKSDFLYGMIEEEVYVCQPHSFEDPHFPDKVYKDKHIEVSSKSKEVETLRYLSLVAPLKKVGDEAVHKELGDRMERAATTASSLEAKQDSGSGPRCQDTILGDVDVQTRFETTSKQFNDPPLSKVNTFGSREDSMQLMELMAHYTLLCEFVSIKEKKDVVSQKQKEICVLKNRKHPLILNQLFIHQMADLEFYDKHNMVAYLVKSEGSEGFHEIIDFLTLSHIYYALTEGSSLYISLIEQFWQTAALSTTKDGVCAITATIDGRDKIITEASIRRHLKLQDSKGLISLPNAEIFEQLTRMGTYSTPTLTNKLFNNMRRASKGYSGVVTPLFDTMLVQPQDEAPSTSPSRITSLPSLSSHHTTSSTPTTPPSIQTTHKAEETATMPHDLPLPGDRVMVVEEDLKQTKKAYSTAFTKLVLKVKKLEQQVRSGKARRRARIVLLEDKDAAEDVETQEKNSADTKVLLGEETLTKLIEDLGSGEKGEKEVSIADVPVSTAGTEVSTGTHDVSMAATTLVYIRRSASKTNDKGKAIMQELEPPKKLKKRVQVQMSVDEELARKVQEEEQAKAMAEQEQERINFKAALELQRQLNEREEVPAKAT